MRLFALIIALGFVNHLNCYAQKMRTDSLQALLLTEKDSSGIASLLNELSLAHRNSDYAKSLEFATRGYELAKRIGDKGEEAKGLLFSGVELYYMGNYTKALNVFLQSLRIYEDRNDKKGMASVLNEIGTFNKKQGDAELALKNFQKAYSLSAEVQDSVLMANVMNNLGVVYELRNEDDKAMDYYLRSARIKEKLHDLYGLCYNYDNIGISLSKRGRYKEANEYFVKVISIRRELGDKTGLAVSINNLGEMYMATGDLLRGRQKLFEALAISFEINYADLRRHIYSMISETYQKENDYKKAYEFYVKSTNLKDTIFSEAQSKQILDLQSRYETEKKENEIRLLKQENDLKDFRLNQNRLYIIGLGLAVALLLFVGYLWRNRMKLKQQTELESTRASLSESQLEAVITSQERERKRFAADLHDGLGQMISALRLSLSKENPEKNIVDHALGLLNDMNVEIRNIAFNLMPQVLMKAGLEEALHEFATRVNRFGVIQIEINAFDVSDEIPADQKIALYRVCQEWVNNAMKYSGCRNISIELIQHPDELVIIIEDDGQGFDQNSLVMGQGNGWKNISSRLGMMKGSIEINSRPGHIGTTVVISSPRPNSIVLVG